jgi:hypothetical protein
VLSDCEVRVNATCVSQPVDRYDWVLDTEDEFDRVTVSDGPATFEHTWDDDDCKDGSTIGFSLTVHRGAATSSATKSLFVPGEDDLKAPAAQPLRSLRMTTVLELPSSGERGRAQIQLDGVAVSPAVWSGEPVELRVDAAAGTREVAAVVMGGRGEPGLLRIDLSSALEVVPGSLRASEGSVLTQGPRTLVFRLAGHPGERVRFTFELR